MFSCWGDSLSDAADILALAALPAICAGMSKRFLTDVIQQSTEMTAAIAGFRAAPILKGMLSLGRK